MSADRVGCSVDGCRGTALRWERCRRHGAPDDVVAATLDVYEAEGMTAAAEHAGVATTTVLNWAKRTGRARSRIGLSGREVADLTGASHRQIDYWATSGLAPPTGDLNPGYGTPRSYLPDDVETVRVVARLIDAGLRTEHLRTLTRDVRARLLDVLTREGFAP